MDNAIIGVVTITYNSATVLPDFLRCLAGQTYDNFLLFAIDNLSSDETLDMLRDWNDPRLRIIANRENRGVAGGNNQGIEAARAAGCSSVLLINNDTEFDTDLLSLLHTELDTNAAEMICPKMMYFDEPNRIWAAGGAFQPWLGYRSIHLGADEIDSGQHDAKGLVTYVPTCCVLIRSDVFDRVGLMDECYFVYLDDVDFMYRALKRGVRLLYLPAAKLLHKVGRLTGGQDSPFNMRFCARNRMYFMLRNLGPLWAFPMILFYQIYYVAGLILGRFSLKAYRLKRSALLEGIALWRACPPTHSEICRP